MKPGIQGAGSALAVIGLLGVLSLCGGPSGVQPALADELPIATSLTADSYAVTFAGDDAGYSFEVSIGSLGAFATGGGWIALATGGKGSFGFVGGIQPDATFRGHLVWINHDTGLRVQSTSITGFVSASCSSTIQGIGDSTSGPVTFTATVTDAGEPGTSDTFSISITGAVTDSDSGTLQGGDVQVHGTCP
jgi:hypothetical protein